jgi:D-glycero-D-manno-heptose 1,7-bisphosphate phosphatase
MSRGAVFLDRDGTIIADIGYPRDPALVRLLPGAAEGLGRLAAAGWPLVVVSNQSGIARGLLTEADYRAVMDRTAALLSGAGAPFLADYQCPHHPDLTGPCECRKPGTLLFRRAAADHDLDLSASWFVGDRWRDVEPGLALGGQGLLVGADPAGEEAAAAAARGVASVPDLPRAAARIGRPRG